MTVSRQRYLFCWRHALASQEGPATTVDRHVALTLALYMDRNGQSAWPSQDTLAIRTGLTDRTVGRALERLCEEGWLARQARPSPKGKRHKRYGYEYWARLPRLLADAHAKGERRSLFNGKEPGRPAAPLNGESGATSMANAVRTNTSSELVKELAYRKGRDGGVSLRPRTSSRPRAEGVSTTAAQQVRQQRARRDDFVAAYEAEERRAA